MQSSPFFHKLEAFFDKNLLRLNEKYSLQGNEACIATAMWQFELDALGDGRLWVAEKWLKVVVPLFGQPTKINAECKMQNAKCKMQNSECKMQNSECKMQNYSEIVVGS